MSSTKARRGWRLVMLLLIGAAGSLVLLLISEVYSGSGGRMLGTTAGVSYGDGPGMSTAEAPPAKNDAKKSEEPGPPEPPAEIIPYGDRSLGHSVSIRGRVLDADGKPVADAIVAAIRKDTESRPYVLEQASRVRSEEDGFFILGPLDRKGYSLLAIKEGVGIALESWKMPGTWVDLVLIPGARVSGRVTVREGGEPVEGARVIARESGLQFEALTDAEGKYALALLPPTRNTWSGTEVLVVADGFQRASRTNLLLSLDEEKSIDFSLVPGKNLKGRVVDARSLEPIAGAAVSEGWEDYHRRVETDEDGRYELPNVDIAPNLLFSVSAEGYLSQQLQSDGDTTLDFALDASVVLVGRVYDYKERLAPGARVYLHRIQHAPGYEPTGTNRGNRVTTTDESGTFRFTDILPGKVAVIAFHDKFAPGEYGPIEMQMGAKPPEGIDINLKEGLTVTGEVRDLKDNPLPGIQVQLQRWGWGGKIYGYKWIENYIWSENPVYFTDAKGRFELRGAVPGKHYLSAYDQTYGWSGSQVDGQDGQHIADLIISFAGATIEGTFTGADGRPVTGAWVQANGPKNTADKSWRWTSVDGLGRFKLGGLKDGLYDIQAQSSFGAPKPLKDIPAGTRGVELKLEVVQTIRGRVSSALTGRSLEEFKLSLRRQRTGMGRNFGGSNTFTIKSPQGEFERPVQPGTWTVSVSATGHAPRIVRDVIIEEHIEPQPLFLNLDAGGGVKGTARDRDGKPIRNAYIFASVYRARGEPRDGSDQLLSTQDRTDSKGRYFLQGMAPGNYLVQLNLGRRGSARAQVAVQGLEMVNQDLQLLPTGSILMRVMDEEGKPIQGVYFYYRDENNQWLGWGPPTNKEGVSLATNLRMGPALAQATHAGNKFRPETIPVDVKPDLQITVDVTLRKKE